MRSLLALFLGSCALVTPLRSATNEAFESIIANPSKENPRNSEGDVVVLKDGTYLAAWTDFFGGAANDFAAARISASRSTDDGKTWGERFTLVPNTGGMNVMSVTFLRNSTGDILLFYCVKNSKTDLKLCVRRSTDEAETWSEPMVVTADAGYHVMNNARAVQMIDGRIICPVAWTEEAIRTGEVYNTVCYFSDDQGHSWQRGKGIVRCGRRGAMEPGVIELKDGRLLQIIRTQFGMIWHAYSSDRGDTWTAAKPWTMVSPEAPSTVTRLPDNGDFLLVLNPIAQTDGSVSHSGRRSPLAAAVSDNEGASWKRMRLLEEDLTKTYAYVSVRFHQNRVLLVYHSSVDDLSTLKFKSIPLAWFRE
jgi:sialidase-1